MAKKVASIRTYGNAVIGIALALYFFIIPFGTLVNILRDPGLHNGEMPRFLYQWHQQLSQKYEPWANQRVESSRAANLNLDNISGTEWPMFSAVYYLWATESLQDAWEANPSLNPTMPKAYAKGAIEAAAALINDPNHANWVKVHWGDDYLEQENLFYRMLLISGLTSYQKLLDDDTYTALLINQVDSLSTELDNSPFGLLDDYPGQCYPIDILPAIAAIQRADEVLGTDHSKSTARAVRGFEGTRLDNATGLPAYIANSKTGQGFGSARGVGISYMLIWVPELWPATAQDWYSRYENHFWQTDWLISGVREFPHASLAPEWHLDVDAGPVINGYGTASTAFAIGATRANGRFDQAYPLSAEALVASWPLLNGTLLGARSLSNLSDAPFISETALLFNLSRQPMGDTLTLEKTKLPFIVYLGLFIYAFIGLAWISIAVKSIKRWRAQLPSAQYPNSYLPFIGWASLILIGTIAIIFHSPIIGIFMLFVAQFVAKSSPIQS